LKNCSVAQYVRSPNFKILTLNRWDSYKDLMVSILTRNPGFAKPPIIKTPPGAWLVSDDNSNRSLWQI